MNSSNTTTVKSWRDVLPVHPAADLFPLMSEAELQELGEDIKKNGLRHPIVIWVDGRTGLGNRTKYSLLDGRNRLDAMELVGIKFTLHWDKYLGRKRWIIDSEDLGLPNAHGETGIDLVLDGKPYDFVTSANAHRRHLTVEQKRDVIAALLKADPTKRDRAIAKEAKTHHHAVAKVRQEEEGRGNISHVEVRTDTKGRSQPATKPIKQVAPEKTTEGERKQLERREKRIREKEARYEARRKEYHEGVMAREAAEKRAIAILVEHLNTEAFEEFMTCMRICDNICVATLEQAAQQKIGAPVAGNNDDGLDLPDSLRRIPGSAS